MAPKPETCAYNPPETLRKGKEELIAGLARIERDEDLKRMHEAAPIDYEIAIARRKLDFVQTRLALLDCVEIPALTEPLIFRVTRNPDKTTAIEIRSPKGATLTDKQIQGQDFVATFRLPAGATYTWKMPTQEFVRRRQRGDTITIKPPKNASKQKEIIVGLRAILRAREIFYRAQLDQAQLAKDGRPIEERVACLEAAKEKLGQPPLDAAAAEIERKLDEEIARIRAEAPVVPPPQPSQSPQPTPPRSAPNPSHPEPPPAAPSPSHLQPAHPPETRRAAAQPAPRESHEEAERTLLAPDFLRGITYASPGSPQVSYAPERIRGDLEYLRGMGVDTLVFLADMRQRTNKTADVTLPREYKGTPSPEDMRRIIPIARSMGFRTVFKVSINVEERAYLGMGIRWCGYIPGSEKWFQAYRQQLLFYARLAEELDVDMMVVGNEMRDSEKQTTRWRETIRQVREVYSGRLTYAGYAKTFDTQVQFYDDLDYIGVNAWPTTDLMSRFSGEIPAHENEITPELRRHYQEAVLKPYLDRMVRLAKRHRKKVVLTEFGCRATQDALKKPSSWANYREDAPSAAVQRIYYECLFELLAKEPYRTHIRGGFLWNWAPGLSNPHVAQSYRGYQVDFPPKPPAQTVVQKYYAKPSAVRVAQR